MASFCLVSNNVMMGSHQSYIHNVLRAKTVPRCTCSSYSMIPRCSFGSVNASRLNLYSNFGSKLVSCSKIGSLVVVGGSRGKKGAHLVEDRESFNLKRRFSLRLRPRVRLFTRRVKRAAVVVRSALNRIGEFLGKHVKKYALVAAVAFVLKFCYLVVKIMSMPSPKTVPYSDLVVSLESGSVSKVLFEEGTCCIYFNGKVQKPESSVDVDSKDLDNGQAENVAAEVVTVASENPEKRGVSLFAKRAKKKPVPEWQYLTRKIKNDESFLLSLMREKGVAYSSSPPSMLRTLRTLILTIFTLWVPLAPLMWLVYRQLNSTNGPAKKRKPSNQSVNFDDVEGVDSAKVELMEVVLCLQGSINYNKLGARLPRGVLLVGPPGTGKTLLARAVAGEAGVPFFSVSASEFVELFVGRGAARIRELFSVARKSSPSIIFIDELDAVGGKRGRSFNDERDQTLNQLLTEMDGFESDTKVVVIAATNRPEALDQALCRPGRFSRKVLVGEPDEEGRKKILAVHFRDIPMEEDKQLICNLVASLTQGFVGADLANIVNEAALLAARRGGEAVAREDIMEAIERAKFGINSRQMGSSLIIKELRKRLPWMPSLLGKYDPGTEGMPVGYQTLS